MVIVDFTAEQFAATGQEPNAVVVREARMVGTRGELNVAISQVQLDGNASWDVTQPLKGSVHLKLPADFDADNVWVQAVFLLTPGRTAVAVRIKPDADGNCSFEIAPAQHFTQKIVDSKSSGPQVALFEIVRVHTDDDGKKTVEVIARPKGLVLQLSVSGSDGN
jgi:hypothetical protein